jgi:hypothetical protein
MFELRRSFVILLQNSLLNTLVNKKARRLMRKPDATWSCRRYNPLEPELPSRKAANRMKWKYAIDTPEWATATETQLTETRAISEPAWATAWGSIQYLH